MHEKLCNLDKSNMLIFVFKKSAIILTKGVVLLFSIILL